MATRIEGDQVFVNEVNFLSTINMKAGQAFAASNLEHQFPVRYVQPSNVSAYDHTEVVHAIYGATGTILAVLAGSVEVCTGSAEVDVDVLVGGSSILLNAITLDSSNSNRTDESGTVNIAATADGNVIEISVKAKGPDAGDFEFVEEFLADAGDTLPDIWGVNAETGNSTEDYVTDTGGGAYSLILDSTSEGQANQLTSNDNLWIDLYEKPIIEWRAKLDLTGTNALGSADQRLVMGVCSAHANAEADLDATTTNAWFRMEGTSANILVEADDASTNTDDQDSGVDLVDDTWTHFKIDFSDLSDVKFYIDGSEQSGAAVVMSNISSTTLVQPIFCDQRDAGAEEEKIYIDNFRVTSGREDGTLAKGVYCIVILREDAA